MNITRSGFELLAFLEWKGPGKYTQKNLADELSVSVGIINKLIREFYAAGLIEVGKEISITENGLEALEPYRIKRAIIIAAGFSERLAPVTLDIPKPLVPIKGIRIIDTLLDALLGAGIADISVVVGYKAGLFQKLLEKYPTLEIIENPLFNQSGNIMTLYAAKKKIDRCYICDADLYVRNPQIIRKYEYSSCFFGVPVSETDDWCFSLSNTKIDRFGMGGNKCYKAIFVSYLDAEDSAKLRDDIETIVNSRGGKECWWFDALFAHRLHPYKITAKQCYADDVFEVDTLGDLISLDDAYSGLHL